jgi:putative addiction module killer protein
MPGSGSIYGLMRFRKVLSGIKRVLGTGYRIYYKMADTEIVVLLCGGDKRTQDEDIAKAKDIMKELKHGAV